MEIFNGNLIWILAFFTLIAVLALAFIQLGKVKKKQEHTLEREAAAGVPRQPGTPHRETDLR